jgi:superfamily II DNA/RNA helicase
MALCCKLNFFFKILVHGDKKQVEREWVLKEFKKGTSPILVATDVAARGLDINDIKCVINYDMANDIETYVHRIGRTARAGKDGISITFFTPSDIGMAQKIKDILLEAKQDIPKQLDKLLHLQKNNSFKRTYDHISNKDNNENSFKKKKYY